MTRCLNGKNVACSLRKYPNKQISNCQVDHQVHVALAKTFFMKMITVMILSVSIATASVMNTASQAMHSVDEYWNNSVPLCFAD